MQCLASWRKREHELFEFEKVAYATFSPQTLAWYVRVEWMKDLFRRGVRPLLSWWYSNKAERAFELYVREKAKDQLRDWYLAEMHAAHARGVADWHVSYVSVSPEGEEKAHAEAWLLRMARTKWKKGVVL